MGVSVGAGPVEAGAGMGAGAGIVMGAGAGMGVVGRKCESSSRLSLVVVVVPYRSMSMVQ